MKRRKFGTTGLEISEVVFGAGAVGGLLIDADDATRRAALWLALDLGINLIDSSAAYRWSEELIAKYVGHRRKEFVFATKCGSGRVLQPDGEWVQTLDYSAKAIMPQIERSLERLKTDTIDIIQLHSPPHDDVAFGDGLDGLKRAQEQGKLRFISLSADGDAAKKAIEIGEYDTLQISYNMLDYKPGEIAAAAREKDMGIIIKQPIANAFFETENAESNDLAARAQSILSTDVVGGTSRVEVALRWLLEDENVHTAIVGTTNIDHLKDNVASVERGKLEEGVREEITKRQRG